MAKWRSTIILSILLHGLLLFFLTTLKVPEIKQPQSPPIKAYMVSAPAKIKATQLTPQQSVNKSVRIEKKPNEPVNKTVSKSVSSSSKKTEKAAEPVNSTITTSTTINAHSAASTPYKKIDLQKGLNRILQQQMGSLPASTTSAGTTADEYETVKRITVPKVHSATVKPLLQIEQQSMQFTTYRKGDTCFKKVFIGAGVMQKNDLPDSYLTAGQLCGKTKLTEAYDAAMNKWLSKK
jgi:hypothetical protein